MIEFIDKLKKGENLTEGEIESILHGIMSGKADKGLIADFLVFLNEKGPTVDEITGAAKLLRQFYLPVETKHEVVLDTCGTGGDNKNTFNISTLSALVIAGAGVVVAKHGNRSVSSRCGSACVLEGLGVNLDVSHEISGACLDMIGIAFLFAQKLHPAMKNVAPVRKELGVKTVFNILGPLINPAKATHQIMGVYSRELIEPIVHVLKNLGIKSALVVHGSDGLDEITTTGKTFVGEFNGKDILTYDIEPEELGIPLAREKDLVGGDIEENVEIARDILNGSKGPKRDIVLLNAAYGLYAAQKVNSIEDGLKLAVRSLDEGRALKKLDELKEYTNMSTQV